MRGHRILKSAYLFSFFMLLYLPILVLIIFSFNRSKYAVGWKGFSLNWYADLISDTLLADAAVNSLIVASLSATVASILGSLAAFAPSRYDFTGKRIFHSALFIVIMSPDIVMGVSLLILFIAMNLEPGFWTLLIAHITFRLPFVAVTVGSRLEGFDKHLVEAAQDLGAGEFDTFRYIILPMVMPAVTAGWFCPLPCLWTMLLSASL